MLRKIIQYLYPRRGLYRVPRRVSADYERTVMSSEEQIILMAGLARDPDDAANVFADLETEHGDNVFSHIHFQLRRQRTRTARERALMLLRQILGEAEPRKFERRRTLEPIVKTNYAHRESRPMQKPKPRSPFGAF